MVKINRKFVTLQSLLETNLPAKVEKMNQKTKKNISNFRLMKERLMQFINSENITIKDFERKIDCSNSTVYRIVCGKSIPTSKILLKIKTAYPKINLNWLVAGEGSMYCDSNSTPEGNESKTIEYSNLEAKIDGYINDLRAINDKYSNQVDLLFQIIANNLPK